MFGALPFIWGTVYTAAIAVVIAVPISLGVALFITQVAPPWLEKPLVYLIDLLAVVPSVVFGLWGVLVLSPLRPRTLVPDRRDHPRDHDHADHHVARARGDRDDAAGDKEAALALGATRWEMIGAAVLPHSEGGLVGRRDARPRPRDGRDDRRRARHRLGARSDHGEPAGARQLDAGGDRQRVGRGRTTSTSRR